MKKEVKEKNLSNKIADNSVNLLEKFLIPLVTTISHMGFQEWGLAVLVVAFVLIALVRIFYKFDAQRRSTIDSILKKIVVKAIFLHLL